jgi:hypothetical protein
MISQVSSTLHQWHFQKYMMVFQCTCGNCPYLKPGDTCALGMWNLYTGNVGTCALGTWELGNLCGLCSTCVQTCADLVCVGTCADLGLCGKLRERWQRNVKEVEKIKEILPCGLRPGQGPDQVHDAK